MASALLPFLQIEGCPVLFPDELLSESIQLDEFPIIYQKPSTHFSMQLQIVGWLGEDAGYSQQKSERYGYFAFVVHPIER
ncbi:hypothetical protein [Gloeomargarita lithophora]|uniref:hypothetical protein n=1 Tax=Gloeomargarita lithophora TaxID=1188228 RepID=UPI0008F9497B